MEAITSGRNSQQKHVWWAHDGTRGSINAADGHHWQKRFIRAGTVGLLRDDPPLVHPATAGSVGECTVVLILGGGWEKSGVTD